MYSKLVLERLGQDQERLREVFGELGAFKTLHGPLSDLHEGHSAVYVLEFAQGKLVYKPRSLWADHIYGELCQQIFLATPARILNRQDYGWMEFFEATPPTARSGFELGERIALLTVLRSSDHHSDNIIYSHGNPQFIDMECVLAPEMSFARRKEPRFSPLATRVFQNFKSPFDRDDVARGYLSGLDRVEENTDVCRSAIQQLAEEPVRVVLRDTAFYSELLAYAHLQEFQNDEEFRLSAVFQQLIASAPRFIEVAAYEAKCICEGRVPRFVYKADSNVLQAEQYQFSGLVDKPGLPLALRYLETDLYKELSKGAAELATQSAARLQMN